MCSRTGLWLLVMCFVCAAIPCVANPWVFRPGLWKQTETWDGMIVHIPPGAPPDLSAKLRAMALPRIYISQFCLPAGRAPLANIIDPAGGKFFDCTEKTAYKDHDVELIQAECVSRPDSVLADQLPRYRKTVQYVGRTGPAKGMMWGVDEFVKSFHSIPDHKIVLRWKGRECGNGASGHKN
jgi:hypothetical protein